MFLLQGETPQAEKAFLRVGDRDQEKSLPRSV
jgi:hypothetical protein